MGSWKHSVLPEPVPVAMIVDRERVELQSLVGFQLVGVGGVAERDCGEGLCINVCAGVG